MNKIRINDVEIAYRDAGAGRALVFLHAFPLNQSMWDGQFDLFAADHRVVSFDWRGFGSSTIGSRSSTMDVFAEDLAGLLDALGIARATLCAVSMGGYAAFAFYRRFAHRVEGLVLSDTRATPDTEEGRAKRRQMAELALESGPSAIAGEMVDKLLGETTRGTNQALVTRVREMIEANRSEALAAALQGMAERADSTDLLSRIDVPTLIIVGSEDKLTPLEDAERMAQGISGAQLEVIAHAGHLPNLERGEDFNRLLAGFLAAH